MGKVRKQNRPFDVEKMSRDLHLEPIEIMRLLGLPLGRNYSYPSAAAARAAHFAAKPGSAKQAHALQAWINLFLKEVSSVKSRRQAMDLYRITPPDDVARKAIMEVVAYFYGFSSFSACNIKLNAAKTITEAIGIAFDYLPMGQKFVGPQGKLIIARNQVEKGPMAEVFVTKLHRKNKYILFTAYWRGKKKPFIIKAHWKQIGETLEKWNKQW